MYSTVYSVALSFPVEIEDDRRFCRNMFLKNVLVFLIKDIHWESD